MMYQTGTFKLAFIKEPQMQVLELPYANNNLRMIILLPVGSANVNQVEAQQCHLHQAYVWVNACGCLCVHVCVYAHCYTHTLCALWYLYDQSWAHD